MSTFVYLSGLETNENAYDFQHSHRISNYSCVPHLFHQQKKHGIYAIREIALKCENLRNLICTSCPVAISFASHIAISLSWLGSANTRATLPHTHGCISAHTHKAPPFNTVICLELWFDECRTHTIQTIMKTKNAINTEQNNSMKRSFQN